MLGGLDPIIIFQFAKNVDPTFIGPQNSTIGRIPIISQIPTVVDMPPIPVYLSESTTEIMIDSESKNVDIETDTETLSNGTDPNVTQKGIASVVSINMVAKKDNISITLLSSLMDYVFNKVTSKEYAITYIHGAITVFRGVLHSYSVEQSASSELIMIKIELSKGTTKPTKPAEVPTVVKTTGLVPL